MIRCSFSDAADCSECLRTSCPLDDMDDEEYAAYAANYLENWQSPEYGESYYGKAEYWDER